MSLSTEQKRLLFTNLVRADHYDRAMYKRMMAGKLLGFYHPGEGGIAPGVAACSFLKKDDFFTPHHRAHGMTAMLSKGIDLRYYLAEHTGKATGCCKGRSSFHACFPEFGQFMYSGFIGYQFGPAVGWGWAAKQNARGQVVMLGSGDGAYGQGRAHEAMLMASNWQLPIIFWCENNGMAIHAEQSEMHPAEHVSSLASAYEMPAHIVDGQDIFACAEIALEVVERVRAGGGPEFVECKTVRFREHDIGTPDLVGSEPRSDTFIDELRKRDPVELATQRLLSEGVLKKDEVGAIRQAAENEVKDAWAWADEQPISTPTEQELIQAVYAP